MICPVICLDEEDQKPEKDGLDIAVAKRVPWHESEKKVEAKEKPKLRIRLPLPVSLGGGETLRKKEGRKKRGNFRRKKRRKKKELVARLSTKDKEKGKGIPNFRGATKRGTRIFRGSRSDP